MQRALLVSVLVGACSGEHGDVADAAVDAAIDATPVDAAIDADVCDPECQFASTFPINIDYSPADGGDRTSYVMEGETSSQIIEFRFDEANGTFEHRVGGACDPVQDNPDFVVYTIHALNKDLVGCAVRASWDMINYECPTWIIDAINSDDGLVLTLNTDQFKTNTDNLCGLFLDEWHFPHDSYAWWQVTFVTESASIAKRINMFKAPLP